MGMQKANVLGAVHPPRVLDIAHRAGKARDEHVSSSSMGPSVFGLTRSPHMPFSRQREAHAEAQAF